MAVPDIPAAAYLASIPPPAPESPGPKIGVSGGGGEPLVALVVDVEAVEENLFIAFGVGAAKLSLEGVAADCTVGGGKYC